MDIIFFIPFIVIAAGLSAGAGLFFLLAHIVSLPTHQATKAIAAVSKARARNKDSDAMVFEMASRIAPLIRMDEYRKRKYESLLRSAGMAMAPEMYQALAIVKALIFLIPGAAFFLLRGIFPDGIENIFALAGMALAASGIISYIKSISEASGAAKKRREEIEKELPRLVSNIVEGLKSTRDIRQLVESYMRYNDGELSKELFITNSDISSGNAEMALLRLEARIGSSLLSQVIRGLIGVHRGDDGLSYFNNLNRDFKELEFQRLRKLTLKKPPKIKRCSFFLLMAMLAIMLGVVVYAIIDGAAALF
ncbi:MAG: secretion protein F [Lachnospiraceae bacterium]|nr:secretion protein F [Lachnospiraceae bacterium]